MYFFSRTYSGIGKVYKLGLSFAARGGIAIYTDKTHPPRLLSPPPPVLPLERRVLLGDTQGALGRGIRGSVEGQAAGNEEGPQHGAERGRRHLLDEVQDVEQ